MTDAERIAELEERVAYLESELGLAITADQLHQLRRVLNVTPSHAHFLLALHRCRGRSLSVDQLDERIPVIVGRGDEVRYTIRVFAFQIRQRLGSDVLETVRGGYRLTSRGMALVGAALSPLQAAA